MPLDAFRGSRWQVPEPLEQNATSRRTVLPLPQLGNVSSLQIPNANAPASNNATVPGSGTATLLATRKPTSLYSLVGWS